MKSDPHVRDDLAQELQNFEEITRRIQPTAEKIPRLNGVDIHGVLMPLRGSIGGDHILYVDFNRRYDLDRRIREAETADRPDVVRNLRRCKHRAGILVADVSGHRVTDAVIAAMLHQSFLLGTLYELDNFGEITTRLFEHLNTRFFKTTSVRKYFTMIYGEFSEEGRFRFISAAHQPPRIFSREFGRFMPISVDRTVSFPPVGLLPSADDPDRRHNPALLGYKKSYTINEINLLAPGDLLLLHTDGLAEHGQDGFFPEAVERTLRDAAGDSAQRISERLRELVLEHGPAADDISFVILKRTGP